MSVFERHQLSNGLRVVTADMPQVQSVTCMIMLAAGSRYETPDTNGIAHFAEHMFFKGTERRPTAREIGMEVDSLGAEFNAFTSKEYTGYYVKCAADYRDPALDVLVDMIRNSKFETEEIEREKGVIVEEMNMYYDTPRDFIGGVYDQLLYGDQPLGWDIIGKQGDGPGRYARDLPRLRRPLVQAGSDGGRPRRPARRRRARDGAAAARRPRARRDARRAGRSSSNGDNGPRVTIHHKESDQAHLCLGVRSYPLGTPTATRCRCSRRCSGTGMSSRLFTEVRERRGLAYYVFAAQPELHRCGLALLAGRRRHRARDEAVETIAHEFRRIASEAVPAEELEKARALAKGRFVLRLENPQGMTMFGLSREVLEGRAVEPQEVLEGLDAVTAEDVQRVAQDVIGSNGINLALIGPFEDEDRYAALARACLSLRS